MIEHFKNIVDKIHSVYITALNKFGYIPENIKDIAWNISSSTLFKDMDDDVKFGIKCYTDRFYTLTGKINDNLPLSEFETIVMKCLYIGFVKSITYKSDITLYRGSDKDMSTNRGFISTSLDRKVASIFKHKGCVYKIIVPKGSRFIPILGNSYLPKEMEILLPPNSKFTKKGDVYIYHEPTTIPDYTLTVWEKFILNYINRIMHGQKIDKIPTTSLIKFNSFLQDDQIDDNYSMLDFIAENNSFLCKFGFQITALIHMEPGYDDYWKDLIKMFSINILQHVIMFNMQEKKPVVFIDHCIMLEDINIVYDKSIIDKIHQFKFLARLTVTNIIEELPILKSKSLKECTLKGKIGYL